VVEERLGRAVCVEPGIPREVAGPLAGGAGVAGVGRVVAEQRGPAARRRQEPEEGADRGRLPGAVRPEEAEHLAVLDGERHVLDARTSP